MPSLPMAATFTGAASYFVHMNILEQHMKQKIAP
jgi:hypothetical protein